MCSTKGLLAQLLVLPKPRLCFTLRFQAVLLVPLMKRTKFHAFLMGLSIGEHKHWSDWDLDPGDVADASSEVFSGHLCLSNNI